MEPIIWIFVSVGLITFLIRAIIRSPMYVSVLVFFGIPALLILYWNLTDFKAPFFAYVKLFSVAIGSLLISSIRYKPWQNISWLKSLVYIALAINILEAVIDEISRGGLINAIVGAILIFTLAFPRYIEVDPTDSKNNFRYDLGLSWILTYVVWNFVFIYGISSEGNDSPYAAFAVCHLIVPLLLMGKSGLFFLQARAYSLGLFMMIFMSVPFEPFYYTSPNWYNPTVLFSLRMLSLGLGLWTSFNIIKKAYSLPRPQNLLQSIILSIQYLKSKKQTPLTTK